MLDSEQITLVAVLFGIGAAGLAKKWVFGWVYDAMVKLLSDALGEMTKDRDFWKDAFLKSVGHTSKAIDAVQKVVKDG